MRLGAQSDALLPAARLNAVASVAEALKVLHRISAAFALGDDVIGIGGGKSPTAFADRVAGQDHLPQPLPPAVIASLAGADSVIGSPPG